MMEGMLRGRRATAVLQRIDRPEVIGLSIALALMCAAGWLANPFWLAVVIAAVLALGGIGAVRLLGPARPGLGFARYATTAMAAASLALFGRLIPPGAALLLTPVAAVLIWSMLWLELRVARGVTARTMLDLGLVGVVFLAAAGIWQVFGADVWPPPLALIVLVAFVSAIRAAEARGIGGIESIGQALLHVLAVGQVGAAVVLLHLPGVAAPAVVALTFYAWGGAVEAIEEGSSLRSVALEFGAVALLGLLVVFLLDQLP